MQIKQKKNQWILAAANIAEHVDADWFKQNYWINQGRLLGANSGRGTAWTIKSEWGKWVLRHYLRGGLYAKLSKDHYLWTGINNSRAFKEFKLLNKLQKLNLPCPKPVAALVRKKGLFYQNDLIMEHIGHEQTFAQTLNKESQLSDWILAGKTIAQFHQAGVYHSDLNAHNILLRNDQAFLIDFDKGNIRPPQKAWQLQNLSRLKRSIEKISGRSCEDELKQFWQTLLEAYYG
ncbi:MAG: 3-deoxy-D-manno-octulosonic acid kinase [Marinicella sp.]|nr:3-deoxy-D-manno-octulosonic acid kinase [Xanthomonadales bacterium]